MTHYMMHLTELNTGQKVVVGNPDNGVAGMVVDHTVLGHDHTVVIATGQGVAQYNLQPWDDLGPHVYVNDPEPQNDVATRQKLVVQNRHSGLTTVGNGDPATFAQMRASQNTAVAVST